MSDQELMGAHIETGVGNGTGEWYRLSGTYDVTIYSTSWDTADAGVETLVEGTRATPTKLLDIAETALVGVPTDTGLVRVTLADGFYRLKVANGGGSESITWHARPVVG